MSRTTPPSGRSLGLVTLAALALIALMILAGGDASALPILTASWPG